jgi:hypothetical protein
MYYFYLNYIRLNSMCNKLEILLDLNSIYVSFFKFFLEGESVSLAGAGRFKTPW